MKFLYMWLILAAQKGNDVCSLQGKGVHYPSHRIIGGKLAFIYAYPSTACLILKGPEGEDFRGGAVIVAEYWVLTAAHCLNFVSDEDVREGLAFVRSNSANWMQGYNEHRITERHVHEQYEQEITDYDIAALKVKQPFNDKHEKPVRIPSRNYKYTDGSTATVLGWGTTDARTAETFVVQYLRFVNIRLVNQKTCRDLYSESNDIVTNRMVCAAAPGKDSCVYDSGGPLIQNNYLIGLVSWGSSTCAHKTLPGVYTRVGYFRGWIAKKIGKNNINN